MALGLKVVPFNIGTGAATTTVDVTHADITSTPIAVVVMWSGTTSAVDAVASGDISCGVGFAVSSSSRRCTTAFSDDAAGSSDEARAGRDDSVITVYSNSTTVDGQADFDSFLSNGVRLIIDDQFSISVRCVALIFFGTDLTAATITDVAEPATAVSTDHTGFGIDNGDLFLFLGGKGNTLVVNSGMQIGCAVNGSGQWTAGWFAIDNQATMNSFCYHTDLECIARYGTNAVSARASFTTAITDGITLNWLERATTNTLYACLAIKGGHWTAGSILTQTDTSTLSSVATTGTPCGGLLASSMQAESTQDTTLNNGSFSIGAFDSTASRAAVAMMNADNVADCVATVAVEHDEVYINLNTSDAVQGLMDVSAIGATGVDFIMDDADPAQAFVGYLVGYNVGQITNESVGAALVGAGPLLRSL